MFEAERYYRRNAEPEDEGRDDGQELLHMPSLLMGGQTTVWPALLPRLRACVSLPRVKVVTASYWPISRSLGGDLCWYLIAPLLQKLALLTLGLGQMGVLDMAVASDVVGHRGQLDGQVVVRRA